MLPVLFQVVTVTYHVLLLTVAFNFTEFTVQRVSQYLFSVSQYCLIILQSIDRFLHYFDGMQY